MQFIEMQWQSDFYDAELRLRFELLRKPLGLNFSAAQLAAESNDLRFGVIQAGPLIAVVLASPLSHDVVKLRQMAVATDHQRRGVGRFLMRNVERALVDKGFSQIELNAREVAVEFYAQLGYVKQGDRFVEVNLPHFKMVKHIGPPNHNHG